MTQYVIPSSLWIGYSKVEEPLIRIWLALIPRYDSRLWPDFDPSTIAGRFVDLHWFEPIVETMLKDVSAVHHRQAKYYTCNIFIL